MTFKERGMIAFNQSGGITSKIACVLHLEGNFETHKFSGGLLSRHVCIVCHEQDMNTSRDPVLRWWKEAGSCDIYIYIYGREEEVGLV